MRLLPYTQKVSKSSVILTLVDRSDKAVATPIVRPLLDVLRGVEGGFVLDSGGVLNGRLSAFWMTVP